MRPTLPAPAWWQPETGRYLDRREVKASYWKNGRMSPGLLRARRQYHMKNALVGGTLLAFVAGVFAYSMAAVKQDVFDDVDEAAVRDARRAALSVEDEKRAMAAAGAAAKGLRHDVAGLAAAPVQERAAEAAQGRGVLEAERRRGVLVPLLEGRFPGLLDPAGKTLVWGAPSVDRIGSVQDKLPPQ
ncbi:hypothetical protein B0H10DRAFT_810867 [Mycena sp. CBHHK59/15]|nr:hypothetical protein B0H10DRAFT_810867 [Mycena sp. CBHHK59/15]